MKLILIRHAQSVRNAAFKGNHFYHDGQEKLGTPNHSLTITEKGKDQARAVATMLLSEIKKGEEASPSLLLHSGFIRTRETANIIFEVLQNESSFPVEQNHLLRERDAGHAFEMWESEARQHFPYLESHWDFEGKWFAVPPGGESFIQVMDRVALFLQTLTVDTRHKDKTVYAVTHGGTMRAFQMVIDKVPFEKADELVLNPKNCGIVKYNYVHNVWTRT
ncbi:MAG: histidine phosphatase family protein [Candidatus Pacebacteria bacterium]|nr:histidine phosphatase family protein [Candidatus Paceibacterota bacterium]